MTKADLMEFLECWNNYDKADENGACPLNEYSLHCGLIGTPLVLKFYLTKEKFDALCKELNHTPDKEDSDFVFLKFETGDYVEIQVDNVGIYADQEKEMAPLNKILKDTLGI